MAVTRIDLLSLPVRDQDRARDFDLMIEWGTPVPDGVQDAPWGRFAVSTDPDGYRRGRPFRA